MCGEEEKKTKSKSKRLGGRGKSWLEDLLPSRSVKHLQAQKKLEVSYFGNLERKIWVNTQAKNQLKLFQ